jgi:hypothetical protein
MTGDARRAARLLVLPTVGLGIVVAFAPGRVELALRIYALLLAGAALVVALLALRRAYPRPRRRRPPSRPWPATARAALLGRLEQELALGSAGAFELHHRLRPRLHRIADELLLARRGVSLETQPERARAALGEPAWELVRPDRPPPEDRQARGLPISDVRAVVEALERL